MPGKEEKLIRRLEESEERYRTLVENLLSPVVIFQDLRLKFANPCFYSISGYSREEAEQEDFDLINLIHEDDRESVAENIKTLLEGKRVEGPRELKFVRKSGEIITGLTFSSLIRYEGKPAIETVVVDITRMKDMERELSLTRERLQYFLDTAPVMIFQLDRNGQFVYANNETLRTMGYRADEWVMKSFAPIVHPEDVPVVLSKIDEGKRGVRRHEFDLRVKNADGELRQVHIKAKSLRDDGQYAGSLVIAQDITEQVRLERKLREARDHLSNIIENAGDSIITLDKEGRIVSWNKAAESMFHLAEMEATGKPFDFILRSCEQEFPALLQRVASGETIRDREIEHHLSDGAWVAALLTYSPIRNAAGAVVGVSCFAKDVTARRHLENELKREKQFIDRLIEHANALIGAANEKGKLVIFNRCFEEVSGFSKQEALGKDPLELLVPEEYREAASQQIKNVTEERPVHDIEAPIRTKDGRLLTVNWSAATAGLASGNSMIIVVGQDVTEQKRMHEELVQSKKLASVGELVSGVAHELNNPLTAVMGYSQLLSTEKALSEKHRQMAQKIFESATRSKRIVENLLAFARKKKPEKHEVALNEVLEKTLALREHHLLVHNMRIVRDYGEGLPPIYADGHQLQQVFLNVINNAYDAMYEAHGGGTLVVRTYKRRNRVAIEFLDDGPGVPASIQEKIFDPFFTTKEVGKGTGLGMSLSYGIVREHGGRIYLDQSYQTGAKFVIELPLRATPPPPSSKASA